MASLFDVVYGPATAFNDANFKIRKVSSRRFTPLDRDFNYYSICFMFPVQCVHGEWAIMGDGRMHHQANLPHMVAKTIDYEFPKRTPNYQLELTFLYSVLERNLRDIEPRDTERLRLCVRAVEDTMNLINSSPPWHDTFFLTADLMRMVFEDIALEIDQVPHMVPATNEAIKKLERKVISATDLNRECAICLEELAAGCEALSMPCLHAFHGDCIEKWLRTSHYCPLCRFKMPTVRS